MSLAQQWDREHKERLDRMARRALKDEPIDLKRPPRVVHVLQPVPVDAAPASAPRELTVYEMIGHPETVVIQSRHTTPKPVTIDTIMRVACEFYGVTREDMISHRRTRATIIPRFVAMYVTRVITTKSLPEIGRAFGGRDHTTVISANRRIERLLQTDPVIADAVSTVSALVRERSGWVVI